MREVLTVKANIDALLGDTQREQNKEQERQRMDGKGAKRRHSDAETSGQFRGVDKPCPPCPYYGKIKEKYGGSTYDDADGQ